MGINKEEAQVAMALIGMILEHGVPAAVKVMKDLKVENPTLEDIEALKARVPRPESYFK